MGSCVGSCGVLQEDSVGSYKNFVQDRSCRVLQEFCARSCGVLQEFCGGSCGVLEEFL